jgi:hypothetical protein
MELAQDRVHLQALVLAVLNIRVLCQKLFGKKEGKVIPVLNYLSIAL